MSIFELLGLAQQRPQAKSEAATETVRKIVDELDSMDLEKARFVAAFAYILGRVAHADLDISLAETRSMEEIVQKLGHMPEDQAVLVVQIAKSQHQLFGSTENFLVTREFAELASWEQKEELLDCLFAVSAADRSISGVEEAQIRQIASELGFSHRQYVEARASYSEHREVLKPLRPDED